MELALELSRLMAQADENWMPMDELGMASPSESTSNISYAEENDSAYSLNESSTYPSPTSARSRAISESTIASEYSSVLSSYIVTSALECINSDCRPQSSSQNSAFYNQDLCVSASASASQNYRNTSRKNADLYSNSEMVVGLNDSNTETNLQMGKKYQKNEEINTPTELYNRYEKNED